jgi:rare lipoprotein A
MRAVDACLLLTLVSLACAGPIAAESAESKAKKHRNAAAHTNQPVVRKDGKASFYANRLQGHKTATGEKFSQEKLTAASPDLPLGSSAIVTNHENGKSVEVEVNDRGPNLKGRDIDLSKKAAQRIGIDKQGVAPVTIEPIPPK